MGKFLPKSTQCVKSARQTGVPSEPIRRDYALRADQEGELWRTGLPYGVEIDRIFGETDNSLYSSYLARTEMAKAPPS